MSDNPMATHGAPSWIEHSAASTGGGMSAEARAFYEQALGWTIAQLPMKDSNTYHGIMLGERPVGGFSSQTSNSAGWMVYITVDDVDKRFEAALKAGATVVKAPFTAEGVGRIAALTDPAGATFSIIAYASRRA